MKRILPLLALISLVGASLGDTAPLRLGLIGSQDLSPTISQNISQNASANLSESLGFSSDGGDRFVSVSGGFARSWLNDYLGQNKPPVEADMTNDLWSWGGVPYGKALVDGKLVSLNTSLQPKYNDWLGTSAIGEPILVKGSYMNEFNWSPPF
jgi:hypothetical protein